MVWLLQGNAGKHHGFEPDDECSSQKIQDGTFPASDTMFMTLHSANDARLTVHCVITWRTYANISEETRDRTMYDLRLQEGLNYSHSSSS